MEKDESFYAQQPHVESLSGPGRAEYKARRDAFKTAVDMDLASVIGVSFLNGGEELLVNELAQRLIRTKIYDSTSFLNSWLAAALAKDGAGSSLKYRDQLEQDNKAALVALEEKNHVLTEKFFDTEKGQKTARTIMLAVNDLVARSTKESHLGGKTTIKLQKDSVMTWGQSWSSRIAEIQSEPDPVLPHFSRSMRQKKLLYK